jgi:uncharacterized protein YecE (DUF72 family)
VFEPPFPRVELAEQLAILAARGIYVGTSSWKYEDWLGLIYSPGRYMRYFQTSPPKLAKARFQKECLAEYAQTFKTVCLDAGFYQFPSSRMIEGYFGQVGADFRLSIKVTEEITVRRWPAMERYGGLAGKLNKHFLNADIFQGSFLAPLAPFRDRIGAIVFEFSHFHPGDWERGRDFVEALDGFFAVLPKGWNYSVEVRNASLLQLEYFAVLRKHGVAHTYNNWTHMPSVAEQMATADSETADFSVARFLLKPGRTFAEAVKKFEPYKKAQEPNEEARRAIVGLMTHRKGFIYVNNRLEGCALWTIYAALAGLLASQNKIPEANESPA